MNKITTKKPAVSDLVRRKEKWGYVFLTPWLFIFSVFYFFPLLYGIGVSFTNYGLSGIKPNGVDNYIRIFNDYAFWRSLVGTVRYAVIVIPLQLIIPLWVANTLRTCSERINTLTKLLIYLPGVTCSVALVVVWNFLFLPGGLASQVLSNFGITRFSIFDNADISIPVLSLLIVFSNMGQNVVIFCGAINGIPQTYYEAAELDGAKGFQQFVHISVPMLYPTIIYVLVTNTIGALQIYVIPQLMTGGGPNFSSSTLLMMIYNSAFINQQFGYASALGVVLFVLAATLAAIQFKLTQRETIEY